MRLDLSGQQILVTGGTGFIGGRLIEKLFLERQGHVRVLVRNFGSASRIARFPVEMVHGDLAVASDIARAAAGCDVIFHCAYGSHGNEEKQRQVTVDGTRNVLAAAMQLGIKRVVHLSTISVYGTTCDGDLDETAPRHYSGNVYSDSKLDAEKMAFDFARRHGLPVTILQPTIVYGPFGTAWTERVLKQLKNGGLILVNGGDGLCNAVYVDDVVSAMLLAAVNPNAVGEAFLISGQAPVTWKDFYGKYERMLGYSGTITLAAEEADTITPKPKSIFAEAVNLLREESVRRRVLSTREMAAALRVGQRFLPKRLEQALARRVLRDNGARPGASINGDKPPQPLTPFLVRFYAAKTRVSIDKAKRILDYQPAHDFESGMKLTEQWARWANLLTQ